MSNSHDGFVILPKFILQNKDLTPESIILYANLLHFCRQGGRGCFAKRSTISKFSNMSLHKLRNAIKVLEDNGIISVCRRRNSLTDVIKITPDCRPPIKEARRPARQAISKPRTTQEIKVFDTFSLRDNNNTQENNICPTTTTTEVVTTPKKAVPTPNSSKNSHLSRRNQKTHKTSDISASNDTPAPLPNPIHQRATAELLGHLKTQIRPKSYEVWFGNSWIEHETVNEVHFRSGKGIYVADWIKDNYIGKLERITGKQVRVTA